MALILAGVLWEQPTPGAEQADGVSKILRRDDADDAVAFGHRHQLRTFASHDATQRLHKGIIRLSDLERLTHDALDVAVALSLQGFDDPLSGYGADKVTSANDREDILQGMK